MKGRAQILAAVGLLAMCGIARADVFKLTDGSFLYGNLASYDGSVFRIDTAAGVTSVPRAQMVAILFSVPAAGPGPAVEPGTGGPIIEQEMMLIPAGPFKMGAGEGTEVTLPDFYIDKYEVTNALYARFAEATGHRAPAYWVEGKVPAGAENLPVVQVSWQDARDYAAWAGKRLPTEAEWEKAARGADGRLYPWGSDAPSSFAIGQEPANFGELRKGPTPVGTFPGGASPYGVMDMAGNVWEWTATGDVDAEQWFVIRGGSFMTRDYFLRCSSRVVWPAEGGEKSDLGFRCVKDK